MTRNEMKQRESLERIKRANRLLKARLDWYAGLAVFARKEQSRTANIAAKVTK